MDDVRARATRRDGRQDQVCVAIAQHPELGEPAVRPTFTVLLALGPTSHEVVADVGGFKAAGVEGSPLDGRLAGSLPSRPRLLQRLIQQGLHVRRLQKPTAGLLDRGEVRHAGQAQRAAEVGVVVQDGDDAAVIGLVELLEDEAGEQLRLRELVRTARMRIWPQRLSADSQRHLRHLPW